MRIDYYDLGANVKYDEGLLSFYGLEWLNSFGGVDSILKTVIIVMLCLIALTLISSILMLIAKCRILKKIGKEPWIALIPVYCRWVFFEYVDYPGWYIFIPFANLIFAYKANYRLAIKMGRSKGVAILNAFIPLLGYFVLALGGSKKSVEVTPSMAAPVVTSAGVVNAMNTPAEPAPVPASVVSATPVRKICANCNTVTPEGAIYCQNCGSKLM